MQAIQTKYLAGTNSKGSRIKAYCERGAVTVLYPYGLSGEQCHRFAVRALVAKFVKEDAARFGDHPGQNPWTAPYVTGGLPDGTYAHVFV